MILLREDDKEFRFRVAGLAIQDGQVLLCRSDREEFWSAPGGMVDMMEESEDTLAREIREEIGAEVEVGRLAWVMEFFFKEEDTIRHELSLYYLMTVKEGSAIGENDRATGSEGEKKMIYRWFRLQDLDHLVLHPKFLGEKLHRISDEVEHIVYSELQPADVS